MVDKTQYAKEQNYFIGVDGSAASEDCFQVVMNGLRRDCDKLTVGHVHDTRKDFLPWNQKPNYIREVYTTKVVMLGEQGHYSAKEFMGGGEEDTKSVLVDLAKENNATMVVCGMHGRKGPKA